MQAWEAAAFAAKAQVDESCEQWNAYRAQYDENDASDVMNDLLARAQLATGAALLCGTAAAVITSGGGIVASSVAGAAAATYCGFIAAGTPELLDAACN